MEEKNTLIIGASNNPMRYSYRAAEMLINRNYPILLYGLKKKKVFNLSIESSFPSEKVHTVTLYIGTQNQSDDLMNNIISLQPERVIFNPGTENVHFQHLLDVNKIPWIEACTLVLLSTNQY